MKDEKLWIAAVFAILVLAAFLAATLAQAAPFLVSAPDPTAAADKCVYQIGAATPVETPLVANACRADMAGIATGTSNLQVWFRSSTWGVDSAKIPFSLTRPAAGFSGPTALTVQP